MSIDTDGNAPVGATIDQTAATFLSMLSGSEPEDRKDGETPPAQDPEPVTPESEAAEPASDEGNPESEQETPQDQPETPEPEPDLSAKYRTKIDGQEIEVTLEEALKGYSRTQDYTRKTQELADRRKALEGQETALAGENAKVAAYLKQVEEVLAEITPKEPNWEELRQNDPAVFAQKWAEWDQHKKEVEVVRQARAEADAAVQRDQMAVLQRHLEAETVKLHEAIPTWKDAAVAKAEKAKMVEYAKGMNFTPEQLAGVTDHRVMLLLHKAMLYDASQAKKPEIKARIEKVKTATPGATGSNRPPVSDSTRAIQRLAKTGKQDDAAAAFLTMLQESRK